MLIIIKKKNFKFTYSRHFTQYFLKDPIDVVSGRTRRSRGRRWKCSVIERCFYTSKNEYSQAAAAAAGRVMEYLAAGNLLSCSSRLRFRQQQQEDSESPKL